MNPNLRNFKNYMNKMNKNNANNFFSVKKTNRKTFARKRKTIILFF